MMRQSLERTEREQREERHEAGARGGDSGAEPRRDVSGNAQSRQSGDAAGERRNVTGPESQATENAARGNGRRDEDRTLSPTEARERYERRRHDSPADGVGFRFDATKPAPGEVDRWMKGLSEDERQALADPRAVVTLRPSASRPGSEDYNQRLTEQRGAALASELKERGVQAQIKVEPLGEREARRGEGTRMSPRAPSDRDKADARDDARYRTATIEIEPYATDADMAPDVVKGQRMDADRLQDDLRQGERIFRKTIADTLAEQVRKQHPLPENPLAPDPSRDPGTLARQIGDILVDTLKNPLGKLRDITGGATVFEGGRIEMREDVARQREPAYEAIARGVASALDPGYGEGSTWSPADQQQRALFEAAKRAVEGLSEKQKDQLGLFLTQQATQHETSYDYLTRNMDGGSYRSGVKRFFDSDKYYDRE